MSALLTQLSDTELAPSLLRRLVEPIVSRWPGMLFAALSGVLSFRDRAGSQTLTGSGAVRYQAGQGARTNFFANPQLGTNATGWSTAGAATSARTADGDFASGQCYQSAATASTSDGFDVVAQMRSVALSAATITVGVAAKVTAGATDWQARAQLVDAAGSVIGSAGAFVDLVPGATVARAVLTITNPTQAGGMGVQVQFRRKTAATSTIRVSDLTIESGSTAGTWFSPVWLDPVSGILGTAHTSPSVSLAAAWVEEGTTNTVPDPGFEAATITTSWTAQGSAAISKVTSHAYLGSNGGKVVCTASTSDGIHQLATSGAAAANGQTWTVSGRVRAFAAGDVGKTVKAAIIERDSGNAVVVTTLGGAITLTDAWQAFATTVTLAGGGTVAKVTMGVMAGAAVAVDFVLDAVQLEQKAYATSYADGSLGTGYSWAGSANASSSTRAASSDTTTLTGHVDINQGSVLAWGYLDNNGGIRTIITMGNGGGSGDDLLQVNVGAGSTAIRLTCRSNNGSFLHTSAPGGSFPVGSWVMVYADWNGTATAISANNAALTTGTRDAPIGAFSGTSLAIGSRQNGADFWAGRIGPVLIMDRPLTAMERSRLYQLGPSGVGFDTVRDAA